MSKYPLIETVKNIPDTVPFVAPETLERQMGTPFVARIGANENVFGPSPKAMAAMREAIPQVWMYGDNQIHDLRFALAKFHNIGIENIAVGEGIDALLGYTCQMFVEPGRKIVTTMGAYPTFNFHVTSNGGQLCFVPFKDDHEDPSALLQKAQDTDATLIYFSNPNNPMGSWHHKDNVQQLIDGVPENTVLLLDEAYIEIAPENTAPDFDVSNPRLLRFRTFSKAYGMAGARIGYCIGEAGLISQMEKVRNHFGVNRIAQAGALAALADQDYLQQTIASIHLGREKIAKIALSHQLEALPSATNFIAIDCKRDEAYAQAIVASMATKGVFIRMPGAAPQSRCIRVSIGKDQDIALFETAFAQTISELG